MSIQQGEVSSTAWFVGASFGHTDDQSPRFLAQGIWEISDPSDKERALVRTMRPGERIAIKAAYVRKRGLPFDNRQQSVSVMGIKAVGIITENPQDGERVKVQWTPAQEFREWYFYTYRATIWRVTASEWEAGALIAFAFEDKPQDIERFRNAPYWRERFGTTLHTNDDILPSREHGSDTSANNDDGIADSIRSEIPTDAYSVVDILKDGCFLERDEVSLMLDRLRIKKNLILQGPPGTGKTWLAKRLAFALIGQKDDKKIRAVQFHPNLSYEDFVRGWRPTGEGKLSLADGVFMEVIKAARNEPSSRWVVVIEEINRGNPAQIFGELLTLLEAGKRMPSEALELCYPDADGVRRPVHVPENLYVIGTMNVADRSLALVDLALRRRFAFVGLEPRLGQAWRDWVVRIGGLDEVLATDIEQRLAELNQQIASDSRLGRQFQIGHSYVTPVQRLDAGHTKVWFRQVVETEIAPLLEEYWFDAPNDAHQAVARLMQGW